MTEKLGLLGWAFSYLVSRAVHVVAELGVADALGDEPMRAKAIAAACGADADSLARLLRLLAAEGVFVEADGGFAHSDSSRLLRTDHPHSARDFLRMAGSPGNWAAAGALLDAARRGGSGFLAAHGRQPWDYYRDHAEEGRAFDGAMRAKSVAELVPIADALDWTRYAVIADIAGGRGHILAAALERAAASQGVLFDLPEVIAGAPEHPRIAQVAGSFFEGPVPAADGYILSRILHDWPDAEAARILEVIRRSAPPHAELIVIETLLTDAPGPHFSKLLDVIMLTMTSGRERTEAQYRALLDRTGWRLERTMDALPDLQLLVARAA